MKKQTRNTEEEIGKIPAEKIQNDDSKMTKR